MAKDLSEILYREEIVYALGMLEGMGFSVRERALAMGLPHCIKNVEILDALAHIELYLGLKRCIGVYAIFEQLHRIYGGDNGRIRSSLSVIHEHFHNQSLKTLMLSPDSQPQHLAAMRFLKGQVQQ